MWERREDVLIPTWPSSPSWHNSIRDCTRSLLRHLRWLLEYSYVPVTSQKIPFILSLDSRWTTFTRAEKAIKLWTLDPCLWFTAKTDCGYGRELRSFLRMNLITKQLLWSTLLSCSSMRMLLLATPLSSNKVKKTRISGKLLGSLTLTTMVDLFTIKV